jgi:hypothetical protein
MSPWTPFWLSLAVPGTGQLLARSWTAVIWFCGVAIIAAAFVTALADAQSYALRSVLVAAQAAVLLAIGVASGIHARALFAPTRPNRLAKGKFSARSRVRCHRVRGRSVRLSIQVKTMHSPAELWRVISDLPSFLTIDPFHERVTLMRAQPAAGVHLVLDHCALGARLRRVGRILAWREGKSFTISDLSLHGNQVGFPHVFTYRVEPCAIQITTFGDQRNDVEGSTLHIEVRGKWTSPVIPAWLGRLWLVGVCYDHARLLRRAL